MSDGNHAGAKHPDRRQPRCAHRRGIKRSTVLIALLFVIEHRWGWRGLLQGLDCTDGLSPHQLSFQES